MLQLQVGGRIAIKEKIHGVELYYPLGHLSRTLLWIFPEFVEPVDDGISTNENRRLQDSYIESKDNDDVDPDFNDEALGMDIDNGMDEEWPGRFYITLYVCFVLYP